MAREHLSLPTFKDIHQHWRHGQEWKQTPEAASQANLAGGISFAAAMPNNAELTTTLSQVEGIKHDWNSRLYMDIALHLGTRGEADQPFDPAILDQVLALKAFFDITTGKHIIRGQRERMRVFERWPGAIADGPIMVHAEQASLAEALAYAHLYEQEMYVCHVSSRTEVELIRRAKDRGQAVYMEVTPHHLMLNNEMAPSPFRMMKPDLGSPDDQEALWQAITDGTADTVGTDDAPHTKEEKQSADAPSGVSGSAETTLPVLVRAFQERGISLTYLEKLIDDNPRHIFNLPDQGDSYVDLDPNDEYIIDDEGLFTKPGWTWAKGLKGFRIVQTVINGEVKYKDGKILAEKGSGRVL